MIENKSEHVLYQPRPSQATLLFFSSLLPSLHYYRGYYMMDSWKYISEQKGLFISEESAFPVDSNGNGSYNKNNNVVIRNELNPIYSFQNYPPPVSNARAFDISELKEMYSNEPCGEVFSTGTGTDSCGNVVVSPFYDQEKDSSYHSLADYVQSKNRDLSIIDPTSSDVTMSRSVKRERFGTRLCGRSPCCQVFGCNKDLSSYKGYYKRHKVCDVHTKTSKVVIGGIEQRFCQQCSRFHLLAEFDDGKRSCRRRLAAHNKRRRKSQHASKSGTKDNISDLESLSTIQQTSSALSLLSAQSHNMPTQLLGASITSPLINKTNHLNSEKTAQSGSHTPGMYLESVNHDANNTTIDVKFQDNGISVGPYLRNNDYDNTNCHNNPLGRGIILDLLQLSSHLQRIEHQKHSTESGAG